MVRGVGWGIGLVVGSQGVKEVDEFSGFGVGVGGVQSIGGVGNG